MIHRTFPLADAAEAHRLMESSEHVGKIVLHVPTGTKAGPPTAGLATGGGGFVLP